MRKDLGVSQDRFSAYYNIWEFRMHQEKQDLPEETETQHGQGPFSKLMVQEFSNYSLSGYGTSASLF